ncbi:MAG: cytochrome c [Anaerolineales bacterium]
MKRRRVLWIVLVAGMLVGLLLTGCSGDSSATEDPSAGSAEPEQEMEEPMEEVEPRDYGVPDENANVTNPIPADDASLQRGEETYISSCINCHGEEGRGDGVVGATLDPKPVDFRAEHVKDLSDGELFYIITNGVEGTAMQAWALFDEEKRWDLVNYLRTFQE